MPREKIAMSYEEAIKKLEELVRLLEDGNMPLEESIKAYEEGISLCGHCNKIIKECEKRITKINIADNTETSILEEGNEV